MLLNPAIPKYHLGKTVTGPGKDPSQHNFEEGKTKR